MWPLLVCSIITVATVLERLFFIIRGRARRKPELVEKILERVEHHDLSSAIKLGSDSRDFVARVLTFALAHRAESFSSAVLRAANQELKKFNRGLSVLDTIVTLAPLLGLLGTVTGMIHAFGLLGGRELDAPQAITGGIAEALVATACGLLIAMICLIFFNWLNTHVRVIVHQLETLKVMLLNRRAGQQRH